MTAVSSTPARTPPGDRARPADLAGLLLARLTVLPALVALFFLLVAFPLLLIGEFRPVAFANTRSETAKPVYLSPEQETWLGPKRRVRAGASTGD